LVGWFDFSTLKSKATQDVKQKGNTLSEVRAPSPALVPPGPSSSGCDNAPNWDNGHGRDCEWYAQFRCSDGHYNGTTLASERNHPDKLCCACGKAEAEAKENRRRELWKAIREEAQRRQPEEVEDTEKGHSSELRRRLHDGS
jgi:hypothetical protein